MLNRLSYIFLLALFTLCAFLYINYSRQRELPPARFTGTERCGVCHGTARLGSQFQIWRASAHARAYDVLSSDSARSYISAHKVNEANCLGCHTTSGHAPRNEAEKHLAVEGVGCERCHGPGSNYSEYNVMLNRREFTARGGVVGSLKDCYQCHAKDLAAEGPHCPFQRKPFDADSAWKKISHPSPDSARTDSGIRIRLQ